MHQLASRAALSFAVCAFSGLAKAEEQQRWLESSRFYGRGNTYVAALDSDEATRANPATLAEPKLSFQLRWLQIDTFVGQNTVDSVGDVMNISADDSAVEMLETFREKFGKRQYGRLQISPLAFRVLKFEFTPFFSSTNHVDMRLPSTPEVVFRSDTLAGANFGIGIPWGKELTVGINLRPAHRTLYEGEMAFSDVIDFVDNSSFQLDDLFIKREGFQIAADLGFIWRPGKAWRFGLLGENVGYAGNFGEFQDPAPPQQQRISVGSHYRMDMKPWAWDFLFDVQDVANPAQYDYLRLIHLGTELGRSYLSRDLDVGVLAGLNEGYFTSGFYVDFWLARLNFSYYAVELGEYPGQRSDRRYGVTLLSSMTF